MKTVFTTGQVSTICRVSQRVVTKWFDGGRLKGYRIPGSQDRRIPRECLITFLKENNMPLGVLEDEQWCKVLLVATDLRLTGRVRDALPADEWFRVERAATVFEAGVLVGSLSPDVAVVDFAVGRAEAVMIAACVRRQLDTCLTIGVVGEDEARPERLVEHGFNEVFKRPFDETLLYDRVRRLAEARRAAK